MDAPEINVINVVIVDVDPQHRARLITCLSDEVRFKIVGAGNDFLEACALPLQQQLPVHVLLINLDQPEMGQVETWAAIHLLLSNARIVGLTSGNDDNILRLALGAGTLTLHLLDVGADVLQRAVQNASRGEADYDPELKMRATRNLLRPLEKTLELIPQEDRLQLLTPREREVLALLGQGLCNRDIAGRLHLGEKTVRNCVSEILNKLELRSRTQAALWVKEHRLII